MDCCVSQLSLVLWRNERHLTALFTHPLPLDDHCRNRVYVVVHEQNENK